MSGLPFSLLVVVAFFVMDGLEKLAALFGRVLWAPPAGVDGFVNDLSPLVLAFLFDALLAAMVLLRTRAGRFWGIIYLVSLTGVSIALYVVEPQRWVDLTTDGRVRELATYAIHLALAGILLGRRARMLLTR